jgi:hypothetical protein
MDGELSWEDGVNVHAGGCGEADFLAHAEPATGPVYGVVERNLYQNAIEDINGVA